MLKCEWIVQSERGTYAQCVNMSWRYIHNASVGTHNSFRRNVTGIKWRRIYGSKYSISAWQKSGCTHVCISSQTATTSSKHTSNDLCRIRPYHRWLIINKIVLPIFMQFRTRIVSSIEIHITKFIIPNWPFDILVLTYDLFVNTMSILFHFGQV